MASFLADGFQPIIIETEKWGFIMNKQAKILTKQQENIFMSYLDSTRQPTRNKIIFMLSLHGFRAKEIASLSWAMLLDASGELSDSIELTNSASKGKNGGRVIYISKKLADLLAVHSQNGTAGSVIRSERGNGSVSAQVIVNFFKTHYERCGFAGASSHSGRRTFITRAANKIISVGGSLRDVQAIVGHSDLRNTQRYIEQDASAQRRVMDMV